MFIDIDNVPCETTDNVPSDNVPCETMFLDILFFNNVVLNPQCSK